MQTQLKKQHLRRQQQQLQQLQLQQLQLQQLQLQQLQQQHQHQLQKREREEENKDHVFKPQLITRLQYHNLFIKRQFQANLTRLLYIKLQSFTQLHLQLQLQFINSHINNNHINSQLINQQYINHNKHPTIHHMKNQVI